MTIGFQLKRQAHITHLTVKEIITATDTTNAASITMVLIFVIIVKQITHQTRVLWVKKKEVNTIICIKKKMYHMMLVTNFVYLAEANATFLAVGLYFLSCITSRTNQFRQRFSIEVMVFILVVTVSTVIKAAAAWCLQNTKKKQNQEN